MLSVWNTRGMELVRTTDGMVTRLAVVRAIRNVSHQTLARQIGEEATVVFSWERGEPIPTTAAVKRLGLALGWRWQDLFLPPQTYDEAWQFLLDARQAAAGLRPQIDRTAH